LLNRIEIRRVGRPVVDVDDLLLVEKHLRVFGLVASRTILLEDAILVLEFTHHIGVLEDVVDVGLGVHTSDLGTVLVLEVDPDDGALVVETDHRPQLGADSVVARLCFTWNKISDVLHPHRSAGGIVGSDVVFVGEHDLLDVLEFAEVRVGHELLATHDIRLGERNTRTNKTLQSEAFEITSDGSERGNFDLLLRFLGAIVSDKPLAHLAARSVLRKATFTWFLSLTSSVVEEFGLSMDSLDVSTTSSDVCLGLLLATVLVHVSSTSLVDASGNGVDSNLEVFSSLLATVAAEKVSADLSLDSFRKFLGHFDFV